jgi:hypothetical protein
MAIPSRQIGLGTESNLLWQILKQLTRLTSIMFSLKPNYKVYTALVTQTGVDNGSSIDTGAVTKGVSYRLSAVSNASDFSNVGGPAAGFAVDDMYFVATDNLTPINYGGGTLYYNTGAPIVIAELENTLGNIWFVYDNVGSFLCKSTELFTENKTYSTIGNPANCCSTDPFGGINISYADTNNLSIFSWKNLDALAVDQLYLTTIEIRVYN